MTALEIVLLLIGIICVAVSFIFFMKLDGPENIQSVNVSLSDKQKEAIKGQISAVFKEQTDELTSDVESRTRDALEHLSNEKIKELSEYSDTVLAEINKNHTEVMFLYDMLNEKSKEVHNNIRDLNLATEAANDAIAQQNSALTQQPEAEKQAVDENVQSEEPAAKPKTTKKAAASKTTSKSTRKTTTGTTSAGRKMTTKPKTAGIDDTAAISEQAVTDETSDADSVKNVEPALEADDASKHDKPISNENKKEAVLSLYNEGKSNVEIAKALGIGVGEVKLVIDLFKGIK